LGLKSLEKQTERRSQKKNNKVNINDISENSSDNETVTLETSSDTSTSSEDINSSNSLDLDNSLESELYNESYNSSKSSKSSSIGKSSICQTPINDSYTNRINECWTKYPFSQNISEYMAEYVEKKINTNDFDNDIIPINLMQDENNSTSVKLDRIPINSNYQNYSVYPDWWGYNEPNNVNNCSLKKGSKKNYQRKMIDESIDGLECSLRESQHPLFIAPISNQQLTMTSRTKRREKMLSVGRKSAQKMMIDEEDEDFVEVEDDEMDVSDSQEPLYGGDYSDYEPDIACFDSTEDCSERMRKRRQLFFSSQESVTEHFLMPPGFIWSVKNDIFPNNSSDCYMNAYTIVQTKVDSGIDEALFNYHNEIIREVVDHCYKKVKDKKNIEMVDSFIKQTERINFLIYWMNRIFTYLDRFFTKAKK